MKQVSKEEFFQTVGPLNVHPRVELASLKGRYHTSQWEMQDGSRRVIGRTESDCWGIEATKFFKDGS